VRRIERDLQRELRTFAGRRVAGQGEHREQARAQRQAAAEQLRRDE
jgi:hypothetical protein